MDLRLPASMAATLLVACGSSAPMVEAPIAVVEARGDASPIVVQDLPRAASVHLGSCSDVVGRWELKTQMPEEARTFDIELLPGGKLLSHDEHDTTTDNDEWSEEDGKVHFWFNDRYVEHIGRCPSNNEMSGTALNVNSTKWRWSARRVE